VRVAVIEDFGDDAVLVAMNAGGLDTLFAALHRARERRWARLECGGRRHVTRVRPGAADVVLDEDCDEDVQWRLDPLIVTEMIDKLAGMRGKGLCHTYIDLSAPADTLVLSVDEYLVPTRSSTPPPSDTSDHLAQSDEPALRARARVANVIPNVLRWHRI
jgi:hypothetical protein